MVALHFSAFWGWSFWSGPVWFVWPSVLSWVVPSVSFVIFFEKKKERTEDRKKCEKETLMLSV